MSEGRNPSLERLRDPDAPTTKAARRGYKVVRLLLDKNPGAAVIEYREGKLVSGEGTHIYLAELNGSDSVSVKLDVPGAGWIEMEEGDIVSREFTQFWVRSNSLFGSAANSFNTIGGPCEALFYVSEGPMIVRAPKKYGLRAGFYTVGGTATTTGVDAWGLFATQYVGLFPKGLPAHLKYGGMLLIQNRHASADIYVYSGVVGSFQAAGTTYPAPNTAMKIAAGVTQPLLIENRLANLRHPDGAGRRNTLIIATSTGTADFTVTASRMIFDLSDPETNDSVGMPPLEGA